jgi:hypothetical protein
MLYDAYEVQRSWLTNASRVASMGAGWLNNPANPLSYGSMGPIAAAGLDVFAHAAAPRGKPDFGIAETKVGRRTVAVHEEVVLRKPFGQLKHFRKDGVEGQPKLLIVAPPNAGKTWLALTIARFALERGESVLFVEEEGTTKGLAQRIEALRLSGPLFVSHSQGSRLDDRMVASFEELYLRELPGSQFPIHALCAR